MALIDIFAHANTLRRKRRGIRPKEINMEAYRAEVDSNGRMLEATIALAGMALKSAMLINGGAAVAMLAYLGNVASKEVEVGSIPGALSFFVAGVLSAAIGTGCGYLCQATYAEGHHKWGIGLRIAAAVLVISSYIFFGLGGAEAYGSFSNQG